MSLNDNLDAQTEARKGKVAEKAAAMEKAQSIIQTALDAGVVTTPELDAPRMRAFIAPVEKNTRTLISHGKVNHIVDPNSPTGKRDTFRDDDIWVEFHDGLCVINLDEDEHAEKQVAWCESHPETCRDITDPLTEAWAFMKEAQQPLAYRDAVLPQNLNVDAALAGRAGGVPHSTVQRAREHLALSEK